MQPYIMFSCCQSSFLLFFISKHYFLNSINQATLNREYPEQNLQPHFHLKFMKRLYRLIPQVNLVMLKVQFKAIRSLYQWSKSKIPEGGPLAYCFLIIMHYWQTTTRWQQCWALQFNETVPGTLSLTYQSFPKSCAYFTSS